MPVDYGEKIVRVEMGGVGKCGRRKGQIWFAEVCMPSEDRVALVLVIVVRVIRIMLNGHGFCREGHGKGSSAFV